MTTTNSKISILSVVLLLASVMIFSYSLLTVPITGEIIKKQPESKTPSLPPSPTFPTLKITHVIDGDTVQLSGGEDIRLIGLNTPEIGQACATEATDKLKEFVLDKYVELESDVEDKDQYGRLLRYIHIDGVFVNLELIRLGLAHKFEYGASNKYAIQFRSAENEAKKNQGCLWKPSKNSCLSIAEFHFNAAGNDNENLNDEYVTFVSSCSSAIDMTSWTVKDETASNIYTFPQFILQPTSIVTLYTGTGINSQYELYWGRNAGAFAAIWNNNGDTLFMRDSIGDLVLTESYSGF